MTLKDAINIRCSRRKYLTTPIANDSVEKINILIEEYVKRENLNIKFMLNNGEAFNGLIKSYGMLSGVRNYIALIDNKKDENCLEKLGYFGELLTLHATTLGLGTCWVGGTFDRKSCSFNLVDDEYIACTITVGNIPQYLSFKEKLVSHLTHRKTKLANEMFTSDKTVPDWFLKGMKAVEKAPSAINRQPVMFAYKNNIVTAMVSNIKDVGAALDLGIAKLHFEIGAGGGNWEFGNGAEFIKILE